MEIWWFLYDHTVLYGKYFHGNYPHDVSIKLMDGIPLQLSHIFYQKHITIISVNIFCWACVISFGSYGFPVTEKISLIHSMSWQLSVMTGWKFNTERHLFVCYYISMGSLVSWCICSFSLQKKMHKLLWLVKGNKLIL